MTSGRDINWLPSEVLDAREVPAGCQVRVLVQEVLPIVDLVLVDLRAELDVPLRLVHPLVELEHPHPVIFIHKRIEFLQLGEERAGRGSDD